MKKIEIIIVIVLTILLSDVYSQINVKADGKVKIGSGTIYPEATLEVQENNKSAEVRVFATTPADARLWTMNQVFSYGIGVDEFGIGHIYSNVHSPNSIIDFHFNQMATLNFGNWQMIFESINSYPAFHPSANRIGYLGTSDYKWHQVHTKHLYVEKSFFETSMGNSQKGNEQELKNSLNKIMKLNCLSTIANNNYNNSGNDDIINIKEFLNIKYCIDLSSLQGSFPELIYHEDTTDKYYIDYIGFIPILINSVQDLKSIINSQSEEINILRSRINKLETIISDNKLFKELINTKNTGAGNLNIEETATLYQNVPNPFSSTTKVKCFIPESTKSAFIYLYNMQGYQIDKFRLSNKGNVTLNIEGSKFFPGTYFYTLIINNKEIDTKKLILTD